MLNNIKDASQGSILGLLILQELYSGENFKFL